MNKANRIVSMLSAGLLLWASVSPAVAGLVQQAHSRQNKLKTGKVATGVPRMDTTKHGGPTKVLRTLQFSKLDDWGSLRTAITPAQVAQWHRIAAKPGPAKVKARALTFLAEDQLTRHEPAKAVRLLDRAVVIAPHGTDERSLARLDHARAEFFYGAYAVAKNEFKSLTQAKGPGLDPRTLAVWYAHARSCAGYHAERTALGITEPTRIDPLCAVASLGVCLRELGLPYSEPLVTKTVRHNGEGSTLQDVLDAAPKLGATAYFVATSDKQKLIDLPKPLVAHVEHDHFISVVKADRDGVEYNCSDCGSWPGGFKYVDWKQWKAMEADAFALITKQGSELDRSIQSWIPGSNGLHAMTFTPESLAFGFDPQAGTAIERATELVEELRITQTGDFLPASVSCGYKLIANYCPDCIRQQEIGRVLGCPVCPGAAPSPNAPAAGDPIDLAVGNEEYSPEDDLTVADPYGVPVHWNRIYNSLSTDVTGFGQGWSHPYVMNFWWDATTTGGGGGTGGLAVHTHGGVHNDSGTPPTSFGYIEFANGARVDVSGGLPTATSGAIQWTVPAGWPIVVYLTYVSAGEYRMTATFGNRRTYTSETGSTWAPLANISSTAYAGIDIMYGTYTVGGVDVQIPNQIVGYGGEILLTMHVDSNGHYDWVEDMYGRAIYYGYSSAGNLDQVSQVVAYGASSPPVWYQYGYTTELNDESESFYFLNTLTKPSPTGSGTSTDTINYYGVWVSGLTDANGNSIVLTAPTSGYGCVVSSYNSSSTLEYQFTVGVNSNMGPTYIKDALGVTLKSFTYSDPDDPFKPSSVTDAAGYTSGYVWNTYGQLTQYTSPKGTATNYTWDSTSSSVGELTEVAPTGLDATYYEYYEPSGLLERIQSTKPGGTGTNYTYFDWDYWGNLTEVESPGNNSTTYHTTTYNYTTDGDYTQAMQWGCPITSTDTLGNVTHMRYSTQGALLNETDASGNEWQADYDIANNPLDVYAPPTGNTGSGSATTTTGYLYINGPVTGVTAYDESGTSTRSVAYSYGLDGETLGVSGDTETASATYNSLYRLKTLSDGNSNATVYSYNTAGETTGISYPLASGTYDTVTFPHYDSIHRLTERLDGNDVETDYAYTDGDGLLSAITYPATTSLNVGVTYDSNDRVTYVSDGTGSVSTTLDSLGNALTSTRTYTGLSGQEFTYSYYPDGSRSELDTPAGDLTYFYDGDGRYTSMGSPAGTSYATYNANSWQASRTLPNGVATNYLYNAVGALTSLANVNTSSTTISSWGSFSYDGVFNTTGFSAVLGGSATGSWSLGYDSKDRLTSASIPGLSSQSFGFDGAGNPTTFKGATQTFNADNQNSSSGAGFTFDGNGNPTSYGGTSAGFDPESRMTSFGSSMSATYRADGLRASKTSGDATTYYLYDGGEPIVEMNSSGTVTAFNIFAPDGLVARETSSATTQYVFDQQGNVAQRLNNSETVLSATQYDPYGKETVVSGTPSDPWGYNAQSGYYLDRETGLYLCQHRYFDPAQGRWANRDPIGSAGGMNLYGYAAGGPMGQADASGLRVPGPGDPSWSKPEPGFDPNPKAGSLGEGLGFMAQLFGGVAASGVLITGLPEVIAGGAWAADAGGTALGLGSGAVAVGLAESEDPDALEQGVPQLFRVCELGEDAALRGNGGIAEPSPTGLESKFFWQTIDQADQYQKGLPQKWGPFTTWQWPNPNGLGAEGVPVDGIPGKPWLIPNPDLPGLPPGHLAP